MDRNWDQDHFNDKDLSKPAVRIHVCAYANVDNGGDEDGNPPTNHWAIFLELPNQRSVRLDMAPGYGSDGLRGKIQISSKRYQVTENAIWTLSFEVAQAISVRTITDLISANKRQKYTFTDASNSTPIDQVHRLNQEPPAPAAAIEAMVAGL